MVGRERHTGRANGRIRPNAEDGDGIAEAFPVGSPHARRPAVVVAGFDLVYLVEAAGAVVRGVEIAGSGDERRGRRHCANRWRRRESREWDCHQEYCRRDCNAGLNPQASWGLERVPARLYRLS